jgi:hypothetical protein
MTGVRPPGLVLPEAMWRGTSLHIALGMIGVVIPVDEMLLQGDLNGIPFKVQMCSIVLLGVGLSRISLRGIFILNLRLIADWTVRRRTLWPLRLKKLVSRSSICVG